MTDCWTKKGALWRIDIDALAAHLRMRGLTVVTVPGAQDRSTTDNQGRSGWTSKPTTLIDHHTATPNTFTGDYPSLRVVRDGRAGLKGPLAQIGLGRSGTVYLIASGLAWHAGVVTKPDYDNWHAVGIEAEDDGLDAVFPKKQYAAYAVLNAAIMEKAGLGLTTLVGHKEAAPKRKVDPVFSMGRMRTDTQAHLKRWAKGSTPTKPVTPPTPGVLKLGDHGARVLALQQGLNHVFGTYSDLDEDGSFGYATASVVAEFQRRATKDGRYHSTVDGIVGPATTRSLNSYGVRF